MIKKFEHIEKDLETMREMGTPKGEPTGFKTFDEFYSIKQGSYTFILGAPHQGKTELAFEIIFNQTQFGKKSLVSSSETGNVAEIYAEFIHKYTGRSIYKDHPNAILDQKYYQAARWVDEWFSIVDTEDQAFSFQELFDLTTDESIILADPYNEHKHDMSDFGTRQDLYIEEEMGRVRRYCKKFNKHMIITLHPSSQTMKEEKQKSGKSIRYYPMPMAREAAGGQALFRKAMGWIDVWRPAPGLVDQNGRPYERNEVVYMVEKAKPKGVAKKGIGSLFFDENQNRYYERVDSINMFAFQHQSSLFDKQPTPPVLEEKPIKVITNEEGDDLPF